MCVCVYVCHSWVFVHEKAYQVRDTAIESSVMTKVKGFGVYNHKVMDVADYVTPTQVGRGGRVCGNVRGRLREWEAVEMIDRRVIRMFSVFLVGRFRLLHHHQNDHHREPSPGILS